MENADVHPILEGTTIELPLDVNSFEIIIDLDHPNRLNPMREMLPIVQNMIPYLLFFIMQGTKLVPDNFQTIYFTKYRDRSTDPNKFSLGKELLEKLLKSDRGVYLKVID